MSLQDGPSSLLWLLQFCTIRTLGKYPQPEKSLPNQNSQVTRYTSYLPLSGSNSYDNTASVYNVSKIVDAHGNFEPAAYEAYSTIFMPATFALGYGISFAVMSCLPVHVYLYHWDDIKQAFMGTSKKDIHARLITSYPDVPRWWYAGMTVNQLFFCFDRKADIFATGPSYCFGNNCSRSLAY